MTTTLNVYKQVMERDLKHWEVDREQKAKAMEEAIGKAKRMDSE